MTTMTANEPEEREPEEASSKTTPMPAMTKQSMIIQTPLVGSVSLGSSWERRYQSLAMFSCSLYFLMPSAALAWVFTLYYLLQGVWSKMGIFQLVAASCMALYLTFCFVLDQSPTGGTRSPRLRELHWWWNHACDYLPLLLVKTADLPADGNYVLGYHPHGIISVGCFGAFATDGARTLDLSSPTPSEKKTEPEDDNKKAEEVEVEPADPSRRGFSSLFPGLDRRVITLPQNFTTPFLREYFLSIGACTSAKETFRSILARPSTAVVVVVGGAAESMHSQVGALKLVLETRRGFVREAIRAQASLVPVIAFGENDLYKTYAIDENSWFGKVQNWVKGNLGFGMPLFAGRSLFFLDFGIMPLRKPVNVVVGAPIPPPKLENFFSFDPEIDRKTDEAKNPDGEILKQHHAKYVEELEKLYNKYKNAPWNQPGKNRRESMQIIKK